MDKISPNAITSESLLKSCTLHDSERLSAVLKQKPEVAYVVAHPKVITVSCFTVTIRFFTLSRYLNEPILPAKSSLSDRCEVEETNAKLVIATDGREWWRRRIFLS